MTEAQYTTLLALHITGDILMPILYTVVIFGVIASLRRGP